MKIDSSQRIHGIDALRGIAMLLGIVLHATIAYKTQALPTWPQDPNFTHATFDYLYFVIHSFRMPLFFLIAGYFCRFLYNRIGEKPFIIHRVKRIIVPFALSLIFILPLTIFPFLVNSNSHLYPGDWNRIFSASSSQLLGWNGMAHLWFLYYMAIYYAVVVIVLRFREFPILKNPFYIFSQKLQVLKLWSFPSLIIASIPACLILMMVPELFLHVDTGILPGLPYLAFFGYFFVLGWLVNRNASPVFSWMTRNTWLLFSVGLMISAGLFWIEFNKPGIYNILYVKWLMKFTGAIQVLCLVYGSIGFFLKYCHSENKVWKYVSDASYWMYLIHLALVVGMQVLFIHLQIPGPLKFILILAMTLIITLGTYQWFVRYTFIGEWLHGKREKPGYRVRKTGPELL